MSQTDSDLIKQTSKQLWEQVHRLSWWCGLGIGRTETGECIYLYVADARQAQRWLDQHHEYDAWDIRICKSGHFRLAQSEKSF